MPVITPCRPRLCATHAVTRSTLGVLKVELERASLLLGALLRPPPPPAPPSPVRARVIRVRVRVRVIRVKVRVTVRVRVRP